MYCVVLSEIELTAALTLHVCMLSINNFLSVYLSHILWPFCHSWHVWHVWHSTDGSACQVSLIDMSLTHLFMCLKCAILLTAFKVVNNEGTLRPKPAGSFNCHKANKQQKLLDQPVATHTKRQPLRYTVSATPPFCSDNRIAFWLKMQLKLGGEVRPNVCHDSVQTQFYFLCKYANAQRGSQIKRKQAHRQAHKHTGIHSRTQVQTTIRTLTASRGYNFLRWPQNQRFFHFHRFVFISIVGESECHFSEAI